MSSCRKSNGGVSHLCNISLGLKGPDGKSAVYYQSTFSDQRLSGVEVLTRKLRQQRRTLDELSKEEDSLPQRLLRDLEKGRYQLIADKKRLELLECYRVRDGGGADEGKDFIVGLPEEGMNLTGASGRCWEENKAKYLGIKEEHWEVVRTLLVSKITCDNRIYQKYLVGVLHKLEGQLLEIKREVEFPNHFTILPDELIEDILSRLEKPSDVLNASNTCQRFQRILEPLKTKRLFAGVVANLVVTLPIRDRWEILKARQVCKDWKRAVDTLLENRHLLEFDGYSDSHTTAERAIQLRNRIDDSFFTVLESSKQLEDFRSGALSSTNPFVGRSLTLHFSQMVEGYLDVDDELGLWADLVHSFWNRAEMLVTSFGMHLWNCRVDLWNYHIHSNHFWPILCKILTQLPNVRRLALQFDIAKVFQYNITPEMIVEMEDSLRRHPFPELAHLVSLEVTWMPALFYRDIFPKFRAHLRHLRLKSEVDEIFQVNMLNCWMPSLESLDCSREDNDATISVEWLAKLDTPRLKKLHVNLKMTVWKDMSGQLLEALKRFSTTLLDLSIYASEQLLPTEVVTPWLANEYLRHALPINFACLQQLTLIEWPHSFDILLYMPCLQSFEVGYNSWKLFDMFYKIQEWETFQIHGYLNFMYKSNLWKLKPSLMEIKIAKFNRKVYYTRQGYNNHVKTNKWGNVVSRFMRYLYGAS